MKIIQKITAVCALGLFVTSCGNTWGPNETAGTLLGAGGGALIGSQIGSGGGQVAATAVGAAGGALLGGYIGREMDYGY